MCAIAGFMGEPKSIGLPTRKRMLETMANRGPDSFGVKQENGCLMLHSRLAVVDIENGAQPMSEGVFTLVYNGELYNAKELREDLFLKGMRFTTRSDTEVVLKAYICYGAACLERFNGIFAFAVYNSAEDTLFLARDRCGVKPLFYSKTDQGFIFASEIKTLLASGLVGSVVDRQGICDLILIGPGRTPGSAVFRDIKEIEPGCFATYKGGRLNVSRYWQPQDHPHTDNVFETAHKVNRLLCDSVERQLVSDVPIGTFLSGGLDSSLISSIANRHLRRQGKRLITFSVGYRDNEKYFKSTHFQPNSDEKYIKMMCDYLDCDHLDVTIDTPELAAALQLAVEARDLPGMADVDSSLLLFCKEIKKYVTVALSGECADEIFGGYPWYRDESVRAVQGFPWSNNYEYRASFLKDEVKVLLDPQKYVKERYEEYCRRAPKLDTLDGNEKRMREMVYLNMYWFMQTLLDRKDRMSMYSGLEVRVPFCDHRIAEYLYSVPWSMKDLDGYEKGLLRRAFEGYLPDEILWRKKSPYPKTHNPNYMSAVCSLLEPVLNNPAEPIHEIIAANSVKELFTQQNPQPWYGQLMTTPQTIAYFYMLNHWIKKYNVKFDL